MDEKYRDNFSIIQVAIYFFLALMILPVGIGLAMALPDKMGLLGLLLIFSSCLFVIAGVKQIKYNKKKQVINKFYQAALAKSKQQPTVISKEIEVVDETKEEIVTKEQLRETEANKLFKNFVIAKYQISNSEWNLFYKSEGKSRINSIIIEGLVLALLGSILLRTTRNTSLPFSILFSVGFAIFYGLLKYFLTMKSISANNKQQHEIIVTQNSVIVNGKMNVFRDDSRWLNSIKLIKEKQPMVLEINFGWQTRGGVSNDDLRIPILDEITAQTIINTLMGEKPLE